MTSIVLKSIDTSSFPSEFTEKLPTIIEGIEKELEENNAIKLARLQDNLRIENDKMIKDAVQKFEEEERKARQPLSQAELQQLVSKEYVTFKVEVTDEDEQKHTFTLRELPQSIEKELYSIIKDKLIELSKEGSNIDFKDGRDILEKITNLADMFEPVQDVLAQLCSICLNPKKKLTHVTPEWVKNNLSNYRIVHILLAQTEVNRMRDFFSTLFQGFQRGTTLSRVSAQ